MQLLAKPSITMCQLHCRMKVASAVTTVALLGLQAVTIQICACNALLMISHMCSECITMHAMQTDALSVLTNSRLLAPS
jgi:hypothetical protein